MSPEPSCQRRSRRRHSCEPPSPPPSPPPVQNPGYGPAYSAFSHWHLTGKNEDKEEIWETEEVTATFFITSAKGLDLTHCMLFAQNRKFLGVLTNLSNMTYSIKRRDCHCLSEVLTFQVKYKKEDILLVKYNQAQ